MNSPRIVQLLLWQLLACQLISLSACVSVADDDLPQAAKTLALASQSLAKQEFDEAAMQANRAAELGQSSGPVQQRAGEVLFLSVHVEESLPKFDRANELLPENAPHNWQRGIALGCAGRWSDGAAQFKSHQDVNPDDVENSAWYFLCVAKSQGVAAARKSVIPSRGDARQPMMSVLDMLMEKKTPEEVLAAARANSPAGPSREQALFYGELYIALYYDSLRGVEKAETKTEAELKIEADPNAIEYARLAKEYLAASLKHDTSGYMADTARVYLQSRLK